MRYLRTSTTRLTAALALTALLTAGCADDDGDVAIESPSPSPSASPSPTAVAPEPTATGATGSPTDTREWATCVSTRADLQVSYPADWTVKDYPDGGCAYFDPQPFEAERGTEAPAVAIRLDVEPITYERVKASYLDGEVMSQRDTEIAGHEAIRIEDRQTQGPLGAKGHRFTYLADLGNEKTLVLTTNETDADDFAQAQEVLDSMAERIARTG